MMKDNSDQQYASFRNNIPGLFALAFVYVLLSRILMPKLVPQISPSDISNRISFIIFASSVALIALFGLSYFKMLFLVSIQYGITRWAGSSILNPILSWIFGIGILFLNEHYHGYEFATIHPALASMDSYKGIMHRWEIHFNFTMLRMVSYSMDYYWMLNENHGDHQKIMDESTPDGLRTDKERVKLSRYPSDYSFLHYLAYIFYLPLFLAGPIITFNDFMSQIHVQVRALSWKRTALYGLRLLAALILMETMQHFIYVVAISKSSAWDGLSPFQVSMVGYFNLNYIWLKLLIIWRFFRFWALCDGIDTQENMIRCMSNNYSAVGFWRSWHRSYNRWLIRYVYIPLGGTKYMAYNMWVVFTFVAVWHDISLTLLAWGWLICLFILPEIIAKQAFSFMKVCFLVNLLIESMLESRVLSTCCSFWCSTEHFDDDDRQSGWLCRWYGWNEKDACRHIYT